MNEIIRQINIVETKYGSIKGFVNMQGIQNIALKIRGEQLFIDYYEKPDIARKILDVVAQTYCGVFKYLDGKFGRPEVYCIGNCTEHLVSRQVYENFLLEYDNYASDTLCDKEHKFGIHHCGMVNHLLPAYHKVHNLTFLDVGWGSDFKAVRKEFRDIKVNGLLASWRAESLSPEQIEQDVKYMVDCGVNSVACGAISPRTPDENVRAIYHGVWKYGALG
jgi:hypothetical protein